MGVDLGLAENIIEILNYIGQKLGIAIDWSADNVLPYLQKLGEKYITYKISLDWFWICLGAVVILLGLICWFIVDHIYDGEGFGLFIFCVGVLIGGAVIACNVYDMIQCRTFPEKVLFEYVQSIWKNGSYR
jgi:hypothetical protein